MTYSLAQAVHHYTQAHARADGVAITTVPGLVLIRSIIPTDLEHTIVRPLLCLVLQGRKQVSIGNSERSYAAGDTMLVTGNLPTISCIVTASQASPYLSIALDLNEQVITELNTTHPNQGLSAQEHAHASMELKSAVQRLVALLEQPHSLAVLRDSLIREIHHWLLRGPQGPAIRRLGLPNSQVQRIARTVALLRADYKKPLPIERLAETAGMSRSAFHKHFRAATSLSPLQFQKQLRLIEARRLIQLKGRSSSSAAYEVGYESVSQFSREYARLFGLPPHKDKVATQSRLILHKETCARS